MTPTLRIEARYPLVKETTSVALKEALERPDRLLLAADVKREPRAFRLSLARELGQKRGKGPGSFVGQTREDTVQFYRSVVQSLHVWQASAPKLPTPTGSDTEVASDVPPDFSEPGARDAGEGVDPSDPGTKQDSGANSLGG